MVKGYTGSNTPESIRDSWRTPKEVFDYYNKRFNFTIDMAASKDNHLCDYYIDRENDALLHSTFDEALDQIGSEQHQEGVVWCNPPYSDCMSWCAMVVEYVDTYKVPIVMLLPADTSVKWFKLAYENCTECHFISGRLAFINEETKKPVSGNNKGSVVFIFDPNSPIKQAVSLIDRDMIYGK